MMKKGFLIYQDTGALVNKLTDEQAGQLFKAIFAYESEEECPKLDAITDIVYETITAYLDRNREKYEKVRQKRSEAGKKGMEKRWNGITNDNKCYENITNDNKRYQTITNDNKRYQTITKITDRDRDNDSVRDNDNVSDRDRDNDSVSEFKSRIDLTMKKLGY